MPGKSERFAGHFSWSDVPSDNEKCTSSDVDVSRCTMQISSHLLKT